MKYELLCTSAAMHRPLAQALETLVDIPRPRGLIDTRGGHQLLLLRLQETHTGVFLSEETPWREGIVKEAVASLVGGSGYRLFAQVE